VAGRVQGKVALVTGIGLGQGRAHAVRLAEEGAAVVGVDAIEQYDAVPYRMATAADIETTRRLVQAAGGELTVHHADVRDRAALDTVVAQTVDEFGRIDAVVANAGVCPRGADLWEITDDAWNTTIDINLKGVFHTVAAAVPKMIQLGNGGSIVLTSSLLGIKGARGMAHYTASKHGVIGLMRSFAVDLGPRMIRVNAVCPNSVDTNMIDNEAIFRRFRPDLENPTREDTVELFKTLQVMPVPWLDPRDIANAVLFLVSDEARYVTGAILPVDLGGSVK
jgi:(+)-trans-carveol dehydrogenase